MTISRTKILDTNAEFWGVPAEKLMNNAGGNSAKYLLQNYPEANFFQIFCGPGNNGGDGYVMARKLLEFGKQVQVIQIGTPKSDISIKNYSLLPKDVFIEFENAELKDENVIIDAILGVGIEGELRQDLAEKIEILNKFKDAKISLDVPTGAGTSVFFKADKVLTFHEEKQENKGFNSEIIPIGMPIEAEKYFGPGDVFGFFPRRKNDSHKGKNGKLLIIGGSEKYHGAPLLSLLGAQSIGIDLVALMVPKDNEQITKNFSAEIFVETFKKNNLSNLDVNKIIEISQDHDACLIGPGLGKKSETKEAVIKILEEIKIPCVIDADAILEFKEFEKIPENSIITPHDGEFLRLSGKEFNLENLLSFSKKFPEVILKKGNVDFISSKENLRENHTGPPILTKGGTGDFLSGMCGALLARDVDNFNSAGIASFLLGISSERYFEKFGDNLNFVILNKIIPKTVRRILNGEKIPNLNT